MQTAATKSTITLGQFPDIFSIFCMEHFDGARMLDGVVRNDVS